MTILDVEIMIILKKIKVINSLHALTLIMMKILIKNGLFFSGRKDEKASKKDVLIDDYGRIEDVGPCDSFNEEGLRIIEANRK